MKRKREAMRLEKRISQFLIRYTPQAIDKVQNVDAERYLQRTLVPMIKRLKAAGIDLKAELEKRRKDKR